MGKERREWLDAAGRGDALAVASTLTSAPDLVKSATFLKRSSALHIAAVSGHVDVLAVILRPLLEGVREEVRVWFA